MKRLKIGSAQLELLISDIVLESVDVIVNSANERLGGGFGVDEAIHKAAGIELLDECMSFPELRPEVRCPTGQCVITGPGKLNCRKVIHTVGPDWRGGYGKEEALLKSAHQCVLELAEQHGYQSLAFPAISCGIFGYPSEKAAPVSLKTIIDFLETSQSVNLVRYLLFSEADYKTFVNALENLQNTNIYN